jgi:hypothetical protein
VAPAERYLVDRRLVTAGATVAAIDRQGRRVVGLRDGTPVALPGEEPDGPIAVIAVLSRRRVAGRPVALLAAATLAFAFVAVRTQGPPPAANATPPEVTASVVVPGPVAPPVRHRVARRRHHRPSRARPRRPSSPVPAAPSHAPDGVAEPAL